MQNNSESSESSDDIEQELDEEDIDHFIEELRRIIHESPPGPGMQARFARTISYLQQKKRMLREQKNVQLTSKKIYDEIEDLLKDIQGTKYTFEKFRKLLKIAQIRELKTQMAMEKEQLAHKNKKEQEEGKKE